MTSAEEIIDIRNKCKEKLSQLFEQNNDNYINYINDIEQSIYEFTESFNSLKGRSNDWENMRRIYLNKMVSIYTNLKGDSYLKNNNLIERIIKGDINASSLALLTPQQLFPEHWEKIIERKNAKDEFLYTKKFVARTNEFRCGKCKKNECTYYQVQIRSSDEPMTTFVTCLECGHKWKFC